MYTSSSIIYLYTLSLNKCVFKNGLHHNLEFYWLFFPCAFQYLFVDSINNYLWNTFDFCHNVQGFSLPFKPTDLLLHSRKSGLVLGYDSSHPNKQVGSPPFRFWWQMPIFKCKNNMDLLGWTFSMFQILNDWSIFCCLVFFFLLFLICFCQMLE